MPVKKPAEPTHYALTLKRSIPLDQLGLTLPPGSVTVSAAIKALIPADAIDGTPQPTEA